MLQIVARRLLGLQQGAFGAPLLVLNGAPRGYSAQPAPEEEQAQQQHTLQQQASTSGPSWPGHYEVSLVIKGFELRFVKQASTVVRDLMLLCFAPTAVEKLPSHLTTGRDRLGSLRGAAEAAGVALAVPLGDRALPTRRTIFTVIRGPHVHKASREQFQRLVHRRVIRYPTNSRAELEWFLDALKSYDFSGVEIGVRITSSGYLAPPPEDDEERAPGAAAGAGAGGPLLAGHMARFPHLFPAAALGGLGSGGGSLQSEMAAAFAGLRARARGELLAERLQLQGSEPFQAWLRAQDRESLRRTAAEAAEAAAAAPSGAGGAGGGLAAIGRAVAEELSGGDYPEAAEQLQEALAAAARKVLADRGLPDALTGASSRAAEALAAAPLTGKRGQDLVDAVYAAIAAAKREEDEQQRRQQREQEQEQGQGQEQAGEGQQQRPQEALRPAAAAAAGGADAYAEAARALTQQLLGLWWAAAQGSLRAELGLPAPKRAQALAGAQAGDKGGAANSSGGGGGGRAGDRAQPPAAAAATVARAAAAEEGGAATASSGEGSSSEEGELEGAASASSSSSSSSSDEGASSDKSPSEDEAAFEEEEEEEGEEGDERRRGKRRS